MFVIAFWRLLLPAAVALPFVLKRREFSTLGWRRWGLLLGAGAFLALHFGTWITGLRLTTVASAVILVETHPLFVLLAERFQGKKAPPVALLGVAVAFLGIFFLSAGDQGLGQAHLLGDALALVAAAASAGYLVVGKSLRQEMRVLPYTTAVYGAASAFLLVAALVTGESLFSVGVRNWGLFILLALGPTTLGHTLSNFALRWLKASTVAMFGLLEAVGATVLAVMVFHQVPSGLSIGGGLLALGGVAFYLWKGEPGPGARVEGQM